MKIKVLVVVVTLASFSALLLAPRAQAGERVVCTLLLNDGGVAARSTSPVPSELLGAPETANLGYTTQDGLACPTNRLQPDGGILAWDGGFDLTQANGQAADGGVAGCPICDFRGATSIVMQCAAPVYYSEKWDGGVDRWGQRGVVAATTRDEKVDYTINPDGYRIDFRGTAAGKNNHISVKPVSASATNFCTFATIERKTP